MDSSGSSSSFRSSATISIFSSISAMISNSRAISSASSKVISWFRETTCPCINSFFTSAAAGIFILSASSRIVRLSGIVICLMVSSGSFGVQAARESTIAPARNRDNVRFFISYLPF